MHASFSLALPLSPSLSHFHILWYFLKTSKTPLYQPIFYSIIIAVRSLQHTTKRREEISAVGPTYIPTYSPTRARFQVWTPSARPLMPRLGKGKSAGDGAELPVLIESLVTSPHQVVFLARLGASHGREATVPRYLQDRWLLSDEMVVSKTASAIRVRVRVKVR